MTMTGPATPAAVLKKPPSTPAAVLSAGTPRPVTWGTRGEVKVSSSAPSTTAPMTTDSQPDGSSRTSSAPGIDPTSPTPAKIAHRFQFTSRSTVSMMRTPEHTVVAFVT